MNNKPDSKKLHLHSETVRTLGGPELAGVNGGQGIISPITKKLTDYLKQHPPVDNTVYNTKPPGQNDTVHDTTPPRIEPV